jgi:hypothetical protein
MHCRLGASVRKATELAVTRVSYPTVRSKIIDTQAFGLRLPPPELAAIDGWIARQPKPRPSRPVAIRRLVELGLKVKTPK